LADRARSLLHFDRVRELADQLDSRAGTLKFMETYLQMLPDRLEKIMRGIVDCDREASHDAVLSLMVASAMSGAISVEACCLVLEPLIRSSQFGPALANARRLSVEVHALYETAPAILLEVHRDLGIAA
jgi:histidine phosphotransfer protein HptB